MFLQAAEFAHEVAPWSLASLQTRLIKIGTRVVRHARAITFHLAEAAISRNFFHCILGAIHRLGPSPVPSWLSQHQRPRWTRSVRKTAPLCLGAPGVTDEALMNAALRVRTPEIALRVRQSARPEATVAVSRRLRTQSWLGSLRHSHLVLGECRFMSNVNSDAV